MLLNKQIPPEKTTKLYVDIKFFRPSVHLRCFATTVLIETNSIFTPLSYWYAKKWNNQSTFQFIHTSVSSSIFLNYYSLTFFFASFFTRLLYSGLLFI